MRPDTNSTRTEALQNSLVGRRGVDRGFCLSSGEGPAALGLSKPARGGPSRQSAGVWDLV